MIDWGTTNSGGLLHQAKKTGSCSRDDVRAAFAKQHRHLFSRQLQHTEKREVIMNIYLGSKAA